MLDAKIAFGLNKIIHNSYFKKKVSLEEQKVQKDDRFLWGRQIAYMIYVYFRVTGAHDTLLDFADLFSVTHCNDKVQDFDTDLTKFCDQDPIGWCSRSLNQLRIRESDQLKNFIKKL